MNLLNFNPQYLYPTIFFGKYILPCNSKPTEIDVEHPIEWLVLKFDPETSKALLLSKYALTWEGFANGPILGSGYETSWNDSYLRFWLNNTFYTEAFTPEEKQAIIPVYNSGSNKREKRSIDKLFLLSADEIKQYFTQNQSSAIAMAPIVGTVSNNSANPVVITYYPITWWSRSLGSEKSLVMCINAQGEFCEIDSNCDEIYVRPALWVKL